MNNQNIEHERLEVIIVDGYKFEPSKLEIYATDGGYTRLIGVEEDSIDGMDRIRKQFPNVRFCF